VQHIVPHRVQRAVQPTALYEMQRVMTFEVHPETHQGGQPYRLPALLCITAPRAAASSAELIDQLLHGIIVIEIDGDDEDAARPRHRRRRGRCPGIHVLA
jgi:hypothetical protein